MNTLRQAPIERFAKTAILPNISGSFSKREALIASYQSQFYAKLQESFSKDSFISRENFQKIYKELVPPLDIKFNFDARIIYDSLHGDLTHILDDKEQRLISYELGIPFYHKEGLHKKDYDSLIIAAHETSHLFRAAIQPKHIGLAQKLSLPDKKFKSQMYFCTHYLYADTPRVYCCDSFGLSIKGYLAMSSKKIRTHFIKQDITKFFKGYNFSPKEKIAALKYWRFMLLDEKNAYKENIKSLSMFKYNTQNLKIEVEKNKKEEKKNASARFKALKLSLYQNILKIRKAIDDKAFRYDEKIQLLEQMIKEEISQIRAGHKQGIYQKHLECEATNES